MAKFEEMVRVRNPLIRFMLAEFFGTFLLIFIAHSCGFAYVVADGVQENPVGKIMGSTFGIGLGAFIGLTCAIPVSGGHINPAITFAVAVNGLFPWNKVLIYMIAQYLGGLVAGATVYLTYFNKSYSYMTVNNTIDYEKTAGMFATFPSSDAILIDATVCSFMASMIFLVGAIAVLDHKSYKAPTWFYSLGIGLVLMVALAPFTGYGGPSVNPAADLPPRLFASLVGWASSMWSAHDGKHWIVSGFIAPHLGATFGVFLYRIFIGIHVPEEKGPDEEEGVRLKEKNKIDQE